MKIKRVIVDPDKDILYSAVSMEDKELFFEKHMDNPGNGKFQNPHMRRDRDMFLQTWSHTYQIKSIELIETGPDSLTILFGDFGHIHLDGKEQIEGFVKSINWMWGETFKPYFDATHDPKAVTK